jgi:two-component system NtrC family sensor kinase
MTFYGIPPLLSLIGFAFLALVVLIRKEMTRVNSLFFMLCINGAFLQTTMLIMFTIQNPRIALWASRIDHIFIIYSIPLFMHFFHAYLEVNRRRWLILGAYAGAFVIMWFVWTPLIIEGVNRYSFGYFGRGGSLYPIIGIGVGLACLYSIGLIWVSIYQAKASVQKNKLKYILLGFGILGLINGLGVLPLLGYPFYPPGTFSFIPLIVFAVGLYRYDLLDLGFIIQKGLFYTILTLVLTCLYAGVVIISNQILHTNLFAEGFYVTAFFFLLVVIIFGPIQSRLQAVMTHYFLRETSALKKSMTDISRQLSTARDETEIAQILLRALVEDLKVSHATLYLRDVSKEGFRRLASQSLIPQTFPQSYMPDGGLLMMLLRQNKGPLDQKKIGDTSDSNNQRQYRYDMEKLWASVVFPMRMKNCLIGFLVLGEKTSRNLINRDERNLIMTLVNQASLAMDNARAYKKLNKLNKTLERQVAKRTRALEQALKQIKQSQEHLIRAESLAAIGQLVAGVAHELNNPISASMSLMQSTQSELDSHKVSIRESVRDDMAYIIKALGRMKQIVSSLLCLSHQTDSYTEPVDVNAVVQDALRILDGQIKNTDIQVASDYQWPIPTIQGNFAHLGQVAINIIQNACQSMSNQPGTVKLTTQYRSDKQEVVFACQDEGPGINPTIKQDIFKPFFTTKPAGQGTGLGLYISHEIVRKHQGNIYQENGPDGGSRFEVILPVGD